MQLSSDGLFFDRIVKTFGGTLALRGVSLRVGRGEIVALLGENGAGKSTLIKVLGGIHRPDQGGVSIDGLPYLHEAGRVGRQKVAFIHQDLGLIEWMSVAENIALSLGYVRRGRLIDWRASEARADAALSLVDADFSATARVSSLSRTQKSLVAIARALADACDFLVLYEPTASLPADEVERLFAALRPLKARGVGMIYVSHRLDEIFRLADRVAVLRDGQMVGIRPITHTTSEELVSLIVGRKARDIARPAVQDGPAILTVDGLATPAVGPVSFAIRRGELLGLAGLRGGRARRYRAGSVRHAAPCRACAAGRPRAGPSQPASRDAVGYRAGGARQGRRKRGPRPCDPRKCLSEPIRHGKTAAVASHPRARIDAGARNRRARGPLAQRSDLGHRGSVGR
ncbi:MAG: ATP-binding cassette domain-containing protein, partial [Paracoccaceae bacterium]